MGRNAGAGAGTPSGGVGGGDEGIGAEIDVEEGALRALEENAFARLNWRWSQMTVLVMNGASFRPASR